MRRNRFILRPHRTSQDSDEEEHRLEHRLPPIGQDRDEQEQVGTQAASYWSGQR
jgi:hypothetical protein